MLKKKPKEKFDRNVVETMTKEMNREMTETAAKVGKELIQWAENRMSREQRVTVTSPKRHKGFASEVPKSGKIRHSSQTNFLINVTSPNVKINIRH